jgi:hypothetical protein
LANITYRLGQINAIGLALEKITTGTLLPILDGLKGTNMSKGPHPSHDLEWRDSSHYEYVCRKCDTADTTSGWGKLVEPCSADKKEESND